jgi:hypothetical protein
MCEMKIVSIKTIWKNHLLCHELKFDNGVTGAVADAKCRGTIPYLGASLFAGVTLIHGTKYGMAVMPLDWNPAVGDEVFAPPHWNMP